jgi:hypothetical protein
MTVSPHVHKVGRDAMAIRYGDKNGNWELTAPVRLANFVLGHDVETRSTVLNERMLDVVHPVEEFWNPQQNVAELEIIDKATGRAVGIGLGQWLVRRNDGRLRVVSHNMMVGKHLPAEPQKPFVQDLEDLLKRHKKDVATHTPAFVLAQFLNRSWENFENTTKAREHWGGRTSDTGS